MSEIDRGDEMRMVEPRPPIVVTAKPLDASARIPDIVGKDQHYPRIERWWAAARKRFGPIRPHWKFQCHHCKTCYSAADGHKAGMPAHKIGFSCIGPYVQDDPEVENTHPVKSCDYDGTNRFPPNPVTIEMPGGVTARMLSFAGD